MRPANAGQALPSQASTDRKHSAQSSPEPTSRCFNRPGTFSLSVSSPSGEEPWVATVAVCRQVRRHMTERTAYLTLKTWRCHECPNTPSVPACLPRESKPARRTPSALKRRPSWPAFGVSSKRSTAAEPGAVPPKMPLRSAPPKSPKRSLTTVSGSIQPVSSTSGSASCTATCNTGLLSVSRPRSPESGAAGLCGGSPYVPLDTWHPSRPPAGINVRGSVCNRAMDPSRFGEFDGHETTPSAGSRLCRHREHLGNSGHLKSLSLAETLAAGPRRRVCRKPPT